MMQRVGFSIIVLTILMTLSSTARADKFRYDLKTYASGNVTAVWMLEKDTGRLTYCVQQACIRPSAARRPSGGKFIYRFAILPNAAPGLPQAILLNSQTGKAHLCEKANNVKLGPQIKCISHFTFP